MSIAERSDLYVSTDGSIGGTLAYIAPETLSGRFDIRSDIFSFGCTLYEILTANRSSGAPPRTSCSLAARRVDISGLPEIGQIPQTMLPILQKTLEQDPEARYTSFDELAQDSMQAYEHLCGLPFTIPPEVVPDSANALHNRGSSLANLGFYKDAAEYYRKALALAPDMPDTEVLLVMRWLARGTCVGGIEVFSHLLIKDAQDDRARWSGQGPGWFGRRAQRPGTTCHAAPIRQLLRAGAVHGARLLEQMGYVEEAKTWTVGVPERRRATVLDGMTLTEDMEVQASFRVTPYRQRQVTQLKAVARPLHTGRLHRGIAR